MNDQLSPEVSVVIPTYNRAQQLCQVLPSYRASNAVLEVIVVDDAGTDDTRDCIEQMAMGDSRIRYLRNERNLGAPATRNRGAAQACGEWILESEDDLALGEGCVDTLLRHAQQTEADLIAGRRVWMRLGESESQALARANSDRRSRKPPFNERWMEHNSHALVPDDLEIPLIDGTMLIRRKVFERVQYHAPYGGQSTWREESDFQLSALEQGFRVVFCPHAVTFHYSRASQSYGGKRLSGTAIYAYRVYRNNLVFLRRHQDYLRGHLPKALLLGSTWLTGLVYGLYRGSWLLAVEVVRAWRAKKHGAFRWE